MMTADAHRFAVREENLLSETSSKSALAAVQFHGDRDDVEHAGRERARRDSDRGRLGRFGASG
jgi:hypothetical protein